MEIGFWLEKGLSVRACLNFIQFIFYASFTLSKTLKPHAPLIGKKYKHRFYGHKRSIINFFK